MAKLVLIVTEQERNTQIEAARAQGGDYKIEPSEMRQIAYNHYRFKEIQEQLQHFDPRWGQWNTSVQDVARLVGIALVWRTSFAQVEETWAVWAHLRLGRGGEPMLPDVDARRALGDKIDEGAGWFAWAQKALGLSDAYVAEQKLMTDDLRRMISERL